MIIKVCGIKYQDNLIKITNLPIDMVGLNFYKKSKRYISNLLKIEDLPAEVAKVGVFVNEELETIEHLISKYKLDYVQLHGDETPAQCLILSKKIKVIKAFAISEVLDIKNTERYSMCSNFLFDTKTIGYGGSGYKFDWKILDAYSGNIPFLLAGGIGPDDHQMIKNIFHTSFIGIDINSQFEIKPGEKNIDQVKSFVQKCKSLNTI